MSSPGERWVSQLEAHRKAARRIADPNLVPAKFEVLPKVPNPDPETCRIFDTLVGWRT